MRKEVIAGEDRNREDLERIQKAEELKAHANNLEQGIKKDEPHNKPTKKKAIKKSVVKKTDSASIE